MRRILGFVLTFALAGCGGGSEVQDAPLTVGPCVVSYGDPAFVVAEAKNSANSAPVVSFTLQSIKLGGSAYSLVVSQLVLRNAVIGRDTVQCAAGCGFATQEGTYAFTVSAPGYVNKIVQVNAKYSSFAGGCPASYSGPTLISVTLDPAL